MGSARGIGENTPLDPCGVTFEHGHQLLVGPKSFVRSAARIFHYHRVAQPHIRPSPAFSNTRLVPPSRRPEFGLLLWSEGERNVGHSFNLTWPTGTPQSCTARNALRHSEIAGPPERPTLQEDRGAMDRAGRPQLTVDFVLRCFITVTRQPSGRLVFPHTLCPINNSPSCVDASRTTSLDFTKVGKLEKQLPCADLRVPNGFLSHFPPWRPKVCSRIRW